MTQTAGAIYIFSLLILGALAHKLPEEDFKWDDLVDAQIKENAQEAILVGKILREAARDIFQSPAEDDETDEYFWRGFWNKLTQALIHAAEKIKAFFMQVGQELMESVKEVAAAGVEAAAEAAKKKALEKAVQIVDKLREKSMASYNLPGSEGHAEFVAYFCERMDRVGQRLIERGEKLLAH